MKTVKPKFYIIILLVSLLLSVAGAAFLFYSANFCYDAEIQHFANNAPSLLAFEGICAAAVIMAIVVYFATGKKTVFIKNEEFSFTNTFFSVLSACFSIYFGYMTFKNATIQGKEFIIIVMTALTFLSALWFLLDAFGITNKSGSLKLLSAAPALMATFFTSYAYFTTDYAMNAEFKYIFILMTISFALYYIGYSGVVLEAPAFARKYAAAAVLSTVIGGAVSLCLLATIIYNFSGFNYNMLTACLFVALWLLSIFNFAEFAATAREAIPETIDDGEITCRFSAEEKENGETEETEETEETDSTEGEASESESSDEDEDEDEDIHIPPMKFDDEEEE